MTKKLNIDQIQSELRGGSAFFPGYKGIESPTPTAKEPKKKIPFEETAHQDAMPAIKTKNHQGVSSPVRGTVPPSLPLIPKVRRPIKQRQPFDIFEDQYVKLKSIAEAEKEFENGRSMSQMVRDAIDQYLIDHPEQEK